MTDAIEIELPIERYVLRSCQEDNAKSTTALGPLAICLDFGIAMRHFTQPLTRVARPALGPAQNHRNSTI